MAADVWNPAQYQRFAAERAQPFRDLLDLIEPCPGGQAVDLGCGSGELTAQLHRRCTAARTVGLDSSPAMLARAAELDEPGVSFERGDIAAFEADGELDLVVASASLQWVPDHPALLARLAAALRPGGQLAVQVPSNADHPSHTLAAELAHEQPFLSAMGGATPADPVAANVLLPERYAELLHDLGLVDQHVRLQVYGHLLASAAEVAEWTAGTTLTRFRRALPEELYDGFATRYRERLRGALGDRAPYFYAFKRILLRARRAP